MTYGIRMMGYLCFALCCTLAAWGQSGEQGEGTIQGPGTVVLTIDSTMARALAMQPGVRRAGAEVQAARAALGMARSDYLPTLGAVGAYARLGPDDAFAPEPPERWDLHLAFKQVIFDFGRRGIRVETAKTRLDSEMTALDLATSGQAFQAAAAFYSLLFLQEELASLDAQLADLRQHLEIVERQEETGAVTKYDVLSTQAEVAAARSRCVSARRQCRDAQIDLAVLLGLDPLTDIAAQGSFTPVLLPVDTVALLGQATKKRAELAQSIDEEKLARLGLKEAEAEGLPSLIAELQAGYANQLAPAPSSLTYNWSAGLSLDLPLFSGFHTTYAVKEANAKLEAAIADSERLRREVAAQVLKAIEAVRDSRDAEQSSEVGLRQAEQALDVAKLQFGLGAITNDEYLSAQTGLRQAMLANLAARFDEVASDYQLKQAIAERIWE